MKVCVAGLWHLGTVTSTCLASAGHEVTGFDPDANVVAALRDGRSPIFEPGLDTLVAAGLAGGRLQFTTDGAQALAGAEVLWIAFDTPVDDDDRADVDAVVDRVEALFPHIGNATLVLVSSQLPVGTIRRLEERFAAQAGGRMVSFACSPENLRLGGAIKAFTRPDRVVAGVRSHADRARIVPLFDSFTTRIEWMSVESAEMTKHAVNAFLATSVTFINELAAICEMTGADAAEVERGLKSEGRIGPRAYLSPGGPFAGGTLARDVMFLAGLGQRHGLPTHLLTSVKTSNDAHRRWAQRRLEQSISRLSDATVAVWGLTYKPGTDTLRRSGSVELCRWLLAQGATVRVHDPAVTTLPVDLRDRVTLTESALSAVQGTSALVLATPWPEYREVSAPEVAARMQRALVLDANRFAGETLGRQTGIEYLSVGKAAA